MIIWLCAASSTLSILFESVTTCFQNLNSAYFWKYEGDSERFLLEQLALYVDIMTWIQNYFSSQLYQWFLLAESVFRSFSNNFFGICHFYDITCSNEIKLISIFSPRIFSLWIWLLRCVELLQSSITTTY